MMIVLFGLFFFFRQKTAYEMRISDWSSDVCSSDLERRQRVERSATQPFDLFGRMSQGADSPEITRNLGKQILAERRALVLGRAIDEVCRPLQIGRASCRERVCQYE